MKGVFLTTGGVQGLQTFLLNAQYQTFNTQSGDFRVYGDGTVTDAKGVFITKGGVQALQ